MKNGRDSMKKLNWILLIILIFGVCTLCGSEKTGGLISSKKKEDRSGLFPIIQGKKWGYINSKGEVKITPQFDHGDKFSEGLALVVIGGKFGYIDEAGKITINPQFDLGGIKNFSNGLACVHVGDKYGYTDKRGKYVINPQFNRLGLYSPPLAA